jgi:DNA-binding transcriptional LysR family regulator
MTNIPTELLRTLVTVVDLRSFTKAAHSLGVTQPAVSAQIKRLQTLLGGELLDKRAPGVALTPKGEAVVRHARRLLSVNDQILQTASRRSAPALRVGIPDEAEALVLAGALAEFRRAASVRFEIHACDDPVRALELGDLDLAIVFSEISPEREARRQWREALAWVCAPGTRLGRDAPIPMVLCDGAEAITRLAISALERSGLAWESACRVPGRISGAAAVRAGLGIAAAVRRHVPAELAICDDPRLPKLPELICAIHLREGAARDPIERLADAIADQMAEDRRTTDDLDARLTIIPEMPR